MKDRSDGTRTRDLRRDGSVRAWSGRVGGHVGSRNQGDGGRRMSVPTCCQVRGRWRSEGACRQAPLRSKVSYYRLSRYGRARKFGPRGTRSRPLEGVVGDGLPAVRAARPVVAAFEFEVLRDRAFSLVVLGIRLVYRRRHDVILAAADEEERRAVRVPVVDPCLLMSGLEVRDQAVCPDPAPGCRDVVPVVDLL